MCVLKGFNDLSAKGSSAPNIFPFGIWFANPDTLYLADEGGRGHRRPEQRNPYADAASDTMAGLEKWSFNGRSVEPRLHDAERPEPRPAVHRAGRTRRVTNAATACRGRRRPMVCATSPVSVNGDGTVTIYATTSTVSGGGDQGADPNEVVAITDTLSATTPGSESFSMIARPQNRIRYAASPWCPTTTAPSRTTEADMSPGVASPHAAAPGSRLKPGR